MTALRILREPLKAQLGELWAISVSLLRTLQCLFQGRPCLPVAANLPLLCEGFHANSYDVSSRSGAECRTCCSCCCCSSGDTCLAKAEAIELPFPAGTPLMLEETWSLVASCRAQRQQQALAVVRVVGISYGRFHGTELLTGGEDRRRFLLVDTTMLHWKPQFEHHGCYQFVGPVFQTLLHPQQLHQIAASLQTAELQQSDVVLAAVASAPAALSPHVSVPLLKPRLCRRVDGFDFAQYKLALRLLRAIEPQTKPAVAAALFRDANVSEEHEEQIEPMDSQAGAVPAFRPL
ncbi:hypothetical protein cyc_00025 [Cyclospora cayetanensis]|uniref:Uncharacterized protein n=1 Tax=Cyclospora cayetanensis TaxID=88456 RepID=A0A1D3CSD0_9EIME|nr:hypothetical protein cyc_00025 [Cyclospora cayetanensis]